MSITNERLIRDALGLIGVLEADETAQASEAAHALNVLNELMAEWRADGVDLQFYEQTTQSDTTPIPDDSIPAVKYYLAFALAPNYGRQIDAAMFTLADKYYSRLKRDAVTQKMRVADMTHMPLGDTRSDVGDILNG